MRWPRFRLRTLMIALAAVALLVWVGIEAQGLRRLSKRYQQQALWAQGEEAAQRRIVVLKKQFILRLEAELLVQPKQRRIIEAEKMALVQDIARRPEGIAYFAQLKRKYERAARYPWLPVADDPDPPDWAIAHGFR